MELDELVGVAAGEVGAAHGAGEECVSRDEEGVVGEVEAGAALGVAGGVEDGGGEAGDGDGLVVGEVGVGWGDLGGGDAEPAGLDVHHLDQREVELVVEDGGAGEALELQGSGDVVDVGVGDDDLLEGELVAGEVATMREMLSPGSTTMASREVSSPRMEQLHWRGPTTRISWIMGLDRPPDGVQNAQTIWPAQGNADRGLVSLLAAGAAE